MLKSVLTLTLLLYIGAGLIFLGCGKGDTLTPFPEGKDGLLYSVGVGESRDLSLAKAMATQRTRASMALVAQAQVSALSKDFQQQLGAGATGQINAAFTRVSESLADQRLIKSSIVKTKVTEENGLYSVQMMLGMPIKDNIEDALVKEISQDEALYQEFQAWKGHNDLAKKVLELRGKETQ
jgi:hypothetical protein